MTRQLIDYNEKTPEEAECVLLLPSKWALLPLHGGLTHKDHSVDKLSSTQASIDQWGPRQEMGRWMRLTLR